MNTETVQTKVEQVDINLDELFDGAASATSITVPSTEKEETKKPNTTNPMTAGASLIAHWST